MRNIYLTGLLFVAKVACAQHYDESFNGTGVITGFTEFNGINMIELPKDVIYEPGTKKIIMLNQFNGLGGTLHRFNEDGSPDLSFGVDGVQEIEPEIENRFINVFPTAEGYSIAGFVSPEYNVYSPFVMKINYDGSTNTDFGVDGINAVNSIDSLITYYASMGNSGKISITGWDYKLFFAEPAAGLMQFDADGNYNTTFGYETLGIEEFTQFHAAYELTDGRTIAFGSTSNVTHDTTIGFVTCYLENGLRDESFGTDGFVFPKPESPYYNFQFYRATQGADGSIYLAGIKADVPEYYVYVVKMDINGNIDESFGDNGNAYVQATSVTELRQIVVTPDNELYVLSSGHPLDDATIQTHILKLLANGEPDLTFTNGLPSSFRIAIDGTDDNDDIDGFQMIIQPDGKLVVTGRVDGLSGNTDYFVCRVVTNSTQIDIQEQATLDVKISPNPASSFVSIYSQNNIQSYEIKTLSGTTVAKQYLNLPTAQVPIEFLSSGLYIIQIIDENDKLLVKTFIKK